MVPYRGAQAWPAKQTTNNWKFSKALRTALKLAHCMAWFCCALVSPVSVLPDKLAAFEARQLHAVGQNTWTIGHTNMSWTQSWTQLWHQLEAAEKRPGRLIKSWLDYVRADLARLQVAFS